MAAGKGYILTYCIQALKRETFVLVDLSVFFARNHVLSLPFLKLIGAPTCGDNAEIIKFYRFRESMSSHAARRVLTGSGVIQPHTVTS